MSDSTGNVIAMSVCYDVAARCNTDVAMTYAIFKDFQSGIVGIIGFIGVMLTLGFNARQARIGREAAISHQKETVRVALAEELRLIEFELAQILEGLLKTEAISISFVGLIPFEIYASHVASIGALSAIQARAVIRAYASVRASRTGIKRFGHEEEDGNSFVEKKSFCFVEGDMRHAKLSVEAAIKLLEE
jgi:hypothetical protein